MVAENKSLGTISRMNFDIILEKIGGIGRFQIVTHVIICYVALIGGLVALQAAFISYTPTFRCNVEPFGNSSLYSGLTEDDILNYTTPYEGNEYNGCYRFGYNVSECFGSLDCVSKSAPIIQCDQGFHFDKSLFSKTVVTEFNLICDSQIYFTIESSVYRLAVIVGAVGFGATSDRIGRKPVIIGCAIGTTVFNGLLAASPNFFFFGIIRFIMFAISTGGYVTSFVYILELLEIKWRGIFGVLFQVSFPIGYMLWSFIAYKWRDWHHMQLAVFVVTLPFVFFSIILPESPRWLFSAEKENAARKVTLRIAKINGTLSQISNELWKEAQSKQSAPDVSQGTIRSFLVIFKPKGMRLVSIILLYSWGVNAIVYYGISFGAASLPGNLFLNNIYGGLFEICAYISCLPVLRRFGRIAIMVFCLLATGLCMICSTILLQFHENSGLLLTGTILAYFGKATISVSFAVIYNYTSEIYPTEVRGSANGLVTIGSGLVAALYPFILALYNTHKWLPGIIFSGFSISAGILLLKLPETTDQPLLNTIDEAENFYLRKNNHKSNDDYQHPSRAKLMS